MLVIGIIIIGLGIIAVLAGIAGGIVTMIKELQQRAEKGRSFGLADLPTEFLKALTAFLKAIVKAPAWIALIFIGILLIVIGARMTV
jgi:hypothetical protein